jgi:hypothetical protein
MARAGVNPPSGPPPPPRRGASREAASREPAERELSRARRKPPPPPRRNWLPAVIIVVVALVVIAAVAGFVLLRSDDSGPSTDSFTDACSIADNVAITGAVGYPVGVGVPVATAAPLSGCTFAPVDPTQVPIGVIVTDDIKNSESFDRQVLEDSYESIESVRGLGEKATFLSREGATGPDSIDALLVITDGDVGVEISVAGLISSNQAFDIAQSVGEVYADRLDLG